MALALAPAHDRESCDRPDGSERLAAEAERGGALQVRERGDLAGGETRDRERQVVGLDTAAIVHDADAPRPAFGQLDGDAARAGIEAVFHQFLERRGGAVDDFSRGDLVHEELGKGAYTAHDECYTAQRSLTDRRQSPRGRR